MTRYLCVLIGTLFSVLLMTAEPSLAAPDCGMNTGKAATGTPIPIGTVTSASGVGSFHEADLAVQAYFKCVNANGGIFGRPIVYYQEDDQSKLDVAAQAAKKLVEDIGVYALVGSTSFIECIANAAYYAKHDVLEIGEGIPPQCFEFEEHRGRQCRSAAKRNRHGRLCPPQAWRQERRLYGGQASRHRLLVRRRRAMGQEIRRQGDEHLLRPRHAGLQFAGTADDGDRRRHRRNLRHAGCRHSNPVGSRAAGRQCQDEVDGADVVLHHPVPQGRRRQVLGRQILGEYRGGAALQQGPDNQNWWAVEKAYGGKDDLLDSFAQLGYVAARIAVNAMLSIGDPTKINRETVTAAIQNMKPYQSDILCKPWYWGGPDAQVHNANHTTRIVTITNGEWKEVEGCVESPDPGLDAVLEVEKKLSLN